MASEAEEGTAAERCAQCGVTDTGDNMGAGRAGLILCRECVALGATIKTPDDEPSHAFRPGEIPGLIPIQDAVGPLSDPRRRRDVVYYPVPVSQEGTDEKDQESETSCFVELAERHPAPHAKYLVCREGKLFTATPCYGMHTPWWVSGIMTNEDGGQHGEATPCRMRDSDEWMDLELGLKLLRHPGAPGAADAAWSKALSKAILVVRYHLLAQGHRGRAAVGDLQRELEDLRDGDTKGDGDGQ